MMMTDKHVEIGVRDLVWRQNINTNINSVLHIFLTRRVSTNYEVLTYSHGNLTEISKGDILYS
jgi:hypothetical protein